MFVFCDLIQSEVLGDSLTSLLRTIVLDGFGGCVHSGSTNSTSHSASVVQYRAFSKLQWKNVVKSSIQSIAISLMDETGNLMPFLSIGRTCLTLKFRFLQSPVL